MNSQTPFLNLIEESNTFPSSPPAPEIIMDSKIRELQKKFSLTNQIIILNSPPGGGKTNQLMQFCQINPSSSFSYFLSDNYWRLRQSAFLTSLIRQMKKALGLSVNLGDQNLDDLNVDIEQLKQLFERLNQKIIDLAKQEKRCFYFVIDGLEWAFKGTQGERIIDLLPPVTNPRGVFFLGSIDTTSTISLPFEYLVDDPQSFSILETEKFLSELSPQKEDLQRIQELSGGMPGILFFIRKLCLDKKISVDEIIKHSSQIDQLIDIYWKNSLKDIPEINNKVLALIAFSLVPLSEGIISKILEIDVNQTRKIISETAIIRQISGACFSFYPELYRSYAQSKLAHLKTDAILRFTHFYETNTEERTSKDLLPEYYRIAENFEGLQNLLIPNYLVKKVLENNGFSLARRDLGNAIELSKKNNDTDIIKYGLSISQMRSISNGLIGSSEIQALIALKKYDQALELAYSTKITTIRIRLLSNIYFAMEKDGKTIPRQSLNEIEQMVNGYEWSEVEPNVIFNIALELFPLLPDVATRLMENTKLRESESNPLELFAFVTSMESDNPECDDLTKNIENKELQEIAFANSPWLSKLSSVEIINKGKQTKNIKAKEFLFRNWCLHNRFNPDVHLVIETAIEEITNSDYKIPLRNLRQLSEPLKTCNKESRSYLIKRFEIPLFSNLRSPIEERVRLELNLSEAIKEIDIEEAKNRFSDTYKLITNSPLDTDVSCYCITRLYISLSNIDPNDNLHLKHTIVCRLEDEFIRLIETSADQLEVSQRILRALTLIDPSLALSFSDLLNTVVRRDYGIQEVLVAHIRQENIPVDIDILKEGLGKIFDQRIKEKTILRIMDNAKDKKIGKESKLWALLLDLRQILQDPITRCKYLSFVLSTIKAEDEPQLYESLFSEMKNSWEKIDVVWMRVEVAFDLTGLIAEGGKIYADELYENARALRNSSPLANQPIGVMFFDTLKLATSAVKHLNLTDPAAKEIWEVLLKSIDHIPSVLLKTLLLARMALSRLKGGDKGSFDNLLQDNIIPSIQGLPPSNQKEGLISEIGVCIYKYSPEEARHWIDQLPYALMNHSWAMIAIRIITDTNIFDKLDDEPINVSLDIPRANEVLSILKNIDRDENFSGVGEMFTRAVSSLNSRLSEQQRLSLLVKLDELVKEKLPDLKNIRHKGYEILLSSQIELANRKSAVKTRAKLHKKHNLVVKDAREIDNIADRVFVLVEVAEVFREIEKDLAKDLIEEAYKLSVQIPNLKDRADRLELIAKGFSKLHKTNEAFEALKIVRDIALSLEGLERDEILEAMIQTAHQIDENYAASITDKIENIEIRSRLDERLMAEELSKSPHKITGQSKLNVDRDVLRIAAIKMSKCISSGRSVSPSVELIVEWLASTRYLDFDSAKEIVNWAIEALGRQTPDYEKNKLAIKIINTLIFDCEFLYLMGEYLTSLSTIPEGLRNEFQGLSSQRKFFKVGDKVKAKTFISEWLKANSEEFIKICDPYFDTDQLWILQEIPTSVDVKIICAGNKFGIRSKDKEILDSPMMMREKQRENKKKIKSLFENAWREISDQTPPPTFVVIHGIVYESEEKDEIHDRFILTKRSGLSIGTSLNGFGSKEFFITILPLADVQHVSDTYIDPKLRVQDFFSRVIYFEME